MNLEQIYKVVDNLDREKVMSVMRTFINIDTTVPPGNAYRQ